MVLRYILAWVPMIFIAIVNGSIRDLVYTKYLNELRAHQVSTATGIILFGLYIWVLTNFWQIKSTTQALSIGLIWLGLTVAFEFLFGHYVMGNPWSQLLADYNLLAGRVWIFVLIWTAIAPFVFYSLQNQM
ncbi:MAG: hypothetical protein DSM106950_41750 [Stigonema ocellatum SAG 48.90 = DSM 106950]|nr:hypothetical protein [Stigonema ocellatum SAG 48.90 = DSM 106950]